MKKLTKETRWSRIFRDSDDTRIYESKLAAGEPSLSPDLVQKEWPTWSQDERFDFAKALAAKTKLASIDESVLQHLMNVGNDVVASTIANAVARFKDRQKAMDLLLTRMVTCKEPRGNFYQALANFRDKAVVVALEGEYRRLSQRLESHGEEGSDVKIDYISCCAALGQITSSAQYGFAIKKYADDPDQVVSNFTRSILHAGLTIRPQ